MKLITQASQAAAHEARAWRRTASTAGAQPALAARRGDGGGSAGLPTALEAGRNGLRRIQPLGWLAAFALALWPRWNWAAARLADGSDDPLGLAAIAVLLLAVIRSAPTLRRDPTPGWLAGAAGLALLATLLGALGAPELAAAAAAVLALAAALRAFVASGIPTLPLAGLALLALPLISSLQFYAGYPLRVVTAEVSTWLLGAAGFVAERNGSAMLVDGQRVIVDAPCSGVQMVWMGYFCACTVAWACAISTRSFVRRLASVGVLVLAGNVVRNSVLVAVEASGAAQPAWLHDAVGLAVLAAVCGSVVAVMRRGTPAAVETSRQAAERAAAERRAAGQRAAAARAARRTHDATSPAPRTAGAVHGNGAIFGSDTVPGGRAASDPGAPANRRASVRWQAALAALLIACALLPLSWPTQATFALSPSQAVEAPREWDGRALRPLALGPVESRFAAQFPGRIERLTDGRAVVIWRHVEAPTRMLHPAADCYRGLGYRIDGARLENDAEGRLWRCFVALRDGRRVRVCERIVDSAGVAFTDTSAWFWAASLGRSSGPWQAVTVATPWGDR